MIIAIVSTRILGFTLPCDYLDLPTLRPASIANPYGELVSSLHEKPKDMPRRLNLSFAISTCRTAGLCLSDTPDGILSEQHRVREGHVRRTS